MALRTKDIVSKYILQGKDDVSKAVNSARKSLGPLTNDLAKYGAIAGGVAAAGVAALTLQGLRNIDSLARQSERLRINVADMQALNHITRQAGEETGRMGDLIQEMTIKLGEAAQGEGEAGQALQSLGLDIENLIQLNPAEQLAQIAAGLNTIENPAVKASLASKIFSDAGAEMLDVLSRVPGGIEAARQELSDLGIALDEVDVQKVRQANESLARSMQLLEGIGQQAAVEIAPVISALTDEFLEFAKQAGGVGNLVSSSMGRIADAIAFVADALHGLSVVWEVIKTVATGAFAAILTVVEGLLRVIDTVLGGVNAAINVAIDGLNLISGLDLARLDTSPLSEPLAAVAETAAGMRQAVVDQNEQLHNALMEPLPGNVIKDLFAEAEAAAAASAEQIIAQRQRAVGMGGEANITDEQRQQLEEQLAAVEGFLGRQELAINLAFEKRRETVAKAFENELIDKQTRDMLLLDLEVKHQEALTKAANEGLSKREQFARMSWSAQVQTVAGALEDMTAGVATSNKTMFQLNKAAGVANAIMNTAQGVTRALAEYPPPFSIVMAAVQLAAGLAQVNAIRSTQFGGGTTPSVAGSTPTFNGQPVGRAEGTPLGIGSGTAAGEAIAAEPTRRIVVEGLDGEGLLSKKTARQIIEAINEQAGDGVRIATVRIT